MKIGVRITIAGLVLTAIVVSTACVHVVWWRTAERTSRDLATTINQQIVASVTQQLSSITTEARAAHTTVRTLFLQNVLETKEADKREFVFLSQIQAQPTISWVAFGWPDGSFFGAHKLGNARLEMTEISEIDGQVKRRTDTYDVVTGDIEFAERRFEETAFKVLEQPWYVSAMTSAEPQWYEIVSHPTGTRPSIAFAGPIDVYQKREGALAVIIENTRLSRLLSQLRVGKAGAAFLFDRNGKVIAVPDASADEVRSQREDEPLLPVATAAVARSMQGNAGTARQQSMQLDMRGEDFDVTLTPLSFLGWTLAVVIPQAEILGPVRATIEQLAFWIVGLIATAGLISAWLSQRVIAAPLVAVGRELKNIERFELDRVAYHPTAVVELDNLSRAIADMANGLSAFRKYIPADLVKSLIVEGVEAKPGVALRPLTVMFVDLAGFTGLSERLGDQVLPILSDYLNCVSERVAANHGTIDKFIGDAVMAFWGAPTANPRHAIDACRCAIEIQQAMSKLGLTDDTGQPLKIRVGINSGRMLVGNVGSDLRLNYTVIGDAVNIASRLEAANKVYGSSILIGEDTQALAEDHICSRMVDELTVRGRSQPLRTYELLGFKSR